MITAQVPFAITDPKFVPRERYYDRGFFELEKRHLWPKAWLMACRLEEIPNPGDYSVFEIVDQSVIVVRQSDHSIKAFHNVCMHRATQLCVGSGNLRSGQIVCPFHGWRWSIDGTNTLVYGEEGFAPECLRPDDIRLQECHVDTWGACAWVNLDPDARPLHEALAPAAALLDGAGIANMRVKWWKETILDCNWKVAIEAFHEGYHVMQTHPQLTMGLGQAWPAGGPEYLTFENGHACFRGRGRPSIGGASSSRRTADEFIERSRRLWEGQDAMTLERDIHVFEGLRHKVGPEEDFAAAAIDAVYEYAEGAGIPMPAMADAVPLWGGDVFLFPNSFFLPQYGNALSYRSRPYDDDPERCRFEVWSLTTYPEGQEPERAQLQGRYTPDDVDNWGLIPRQDFSNVARQQRGLHSAGFRANRLAVEWERAISNMHEEIDRYLAR